MPPTPVDTPAVDACALPLRDVMVVALVQAVATPPASRHPVDLGATVVKVERVGEGDFAHAYDDAVHGLGSRFVWLNRGKKSVALDLTSDEGRAGPGLDADRIARLRTTDTIR